ncbi:MAG: hypothetical protein ACLPIG_14290 [Methylocella sp.]
MSRQQVGRAFYLSQEIMGFAEGSGLLWLAGVANGVGLFASPSWTITRLKECAPERAIMVEVTSEANAYGAAEAMADVIQLEKFEPNTVARVVPGITKRADSRPVIAAAGGINAQNAYDYAKASADTLVTSAPFYAKPVVIQVRISPQ